MFTILFDFNTIYVNLKKRFAVETWKYRKNTMNNVCTINKQFVIIPYFTTNMLVNIFHAAFLSEMGQSLHVIIYFRLHLLAAVFTGG